MKMVAAAKMKQDVSRLERAKTYGVGTVQRIINNETYLAKKKAAFTAKKWLLVPITSDKGLCGGVNSSVIREIKAMVKADRSAYKIFVVGDKGSVALSRPMGDILESAITHPSTPMNFPTGTFLVNAAASIAYQVIEHAKDCDRVTIIFNEFKNVISQFQRKVEVLNKTEFVQQFKFVTKHDPDSMSQHADLFYDFYISAAFYNALLNNIASETSSRMNAMENASKNAGEILDSLTLEYNKARQAKITMELCEIISGAAAV
jgi:F-type H+-transporting ATPase subunit gamma